MNRKLNDHEEVYRGLQRARALRNAYLKSLMNRFVASATRVLTERIDSLHRGSFTSMI
jgi:hypothetical protein